MNEFAWQRTLKMSEQLHNAQFLVFRAWPYAYTNNFPCTKAGINQLLNKAPCQGKTWQFMPYARANIKLVKEKLCRVYGDQG